MNIYWVSYHDDTLDRGYWDNGLIEYLFDHFKVTNYQIRNVAFPEVPENEGGIVVINGRSHLDDNDVAKINADLAKLRWCVLIVTGDEESLFPIEKIVHPNMRVWIMSPQQGKHDGVSFRIGSGFREDEPAINAEIGMQDRKYDWFFSGQVTHDTRAKMSIALDSMPNGKSNYTKGFGQGMDLKKYLTLMGQAKFAPAPKGAVSPDNFRLFEALEAGTVPIADGGDWWPYMFGEQVPFPIVSDWSVLPTMMPELLREWPAISNKVFAWWQGYKRRMVDKLEDDVRTVSGTKPERIIESDITVLMPTSAIPSHPSTQMIERTIASVRERLPNAEIIIMIDGLRPDMAEYKSNYDEYIRRLLWKTNSEYKNITPILMDSFNQQTGMTVAALNYVRTPLILFVEHDTPLIHDTPFDQLSEIVKSGYANTIRLNHEDRILDDHKYLQLDEMPQMVMDVPLIRSRQWSQRPHLTSAKYYRDMAEKHWRPEMFIEHVMYGVVVHGEFDEHRLHIYAPEGNMLRSTNLNGRAYEVQE